MAEHLRARYLLQRLRDEAHRFAIGHHRDLRSKRLSRSFLDEVPGIGPARKRELLRAFRSVSALRGASVAELAAVKGMTLAAARTLRSYLEGVEA
jgi:excinuclease ABC subunit C